MAHLQFLRRQKQRSLSRRARTLAIATAAAAAAAASATGSSWPPVTTRLPMRQATRRRGRHQSTKSSTESRSTSQSHSHTLSMAIGSPKPEEASTDGAGLDERARTLRREGKKEERCGTSEQLERRQLDQGGESLRLDCGGYGSAQAGGKKRWLGFCDCSSGERRVCNRSCGLVVG
ncbi:uncharacterized protein [Zea mays]|nr:uncharacterized protein LOC100501171 [Zea mays]XP_008644186.1 uncharacterized protein LOC100501171 isoform X1 [Zea mays]ACR35043.1 unknown [Zea mays]ACR36524.1 unknown [Zea mays]|eukprot:NP_001182892.1 uncharacterized protein LOC100501171 [Zea mays]